MQKIKGVNLGNWLVLEHGVNLVRIPVPYFIFGDRPPFHGCVEYLDKAFDWAEKHDIRILIDLHTVPYSQNGYDNGGLTGVCKWYKHPDEVAFAYRVLDRLAERYGTREGLYGIEVLNEPISFLVWISSPSRTQVKDKKEARGSWYVPMGFLKNFYKESYRQLRKRLPEDMVIVFHDGFRLGRWKDFFVKNGMKNVVLDTHIYVFAMEMFVPIHRPWVYKLYIASQKRLVEKAAKYTPVVVGEWCIANRFADAKDQGMSEEAYSARRKKRYKQQADLQLSTWNSSAGSIYWSYQLLRDRTEVFDETWKEAWDLSRCLINGWIQY